MIVFAVVCLGLTQLTILFLYRHDSNNDVLLFILWLSVLVISLALLVVLISRHIVRNNKTLLSFEDSIRSHSAVTEKDIIGTEQLKSAIKSYNSLVEELEVLKKNLMNHEVRIEGFYNAMINGLIVHDKMKILEVNHSLCEMTGFSSLDLMKMSVDQLFLPHESMLADMAPSEHKLVYRSMCFAKNGTRFPIDIQMSQIQHMNAVVQVSIIRDLREKHEIEKQLQSERARRMQALFDGQEMERRRLAKEIHDGMGQSLIAIRMLIEGKIAGSNQVDRNALEKIRNLIDATISEARMMSNNLLPSVLHEFGFVTALRQMCDQVRNNTLMKVDFDVDCSKFILTTTQTIYLFRIAQETINNILKHAKAGLMRVHVSQTDAELTLIISDDGKGMNVEKATEAGGNGLYNIRERVQLMHGSVEIHSDPGKGTEIQICIPNWRLIANE